MKKQTHQQQTQGKPKNHNNNKDKQQTNKSKEKQCLPSNVKITKPLSLVSLTTLGDSEPRYLPNPLLDYDPKTKELIINTLIYLKETVARREEA